MSPENNNEVSSSRWLRILGVMMVIGVMAIYNYRHRDILIHKAPNAQQHAVLMGFSPQWLYDAKEEAVGGGHVEKAVVKSLTRAPFDPPAQGVQQASLMLRTRPRQGRDVMVNIDKGQFVCGHGSCKAVVQFDGGKPQRYRAFTEKGDNSTLFLRDADTFIAALRNSPMTSIQAELFQEGPRVFTFVTLGVPF